MELVSKHFLDELSEESTNHTNNNDNQFDYLLLEEESNHHPNHPSASSNINDDDDDDDDEDDSITSSSSSGTSSDGDGSASSSNEDASNSSNNNNNNNNSSHGNNGMIVNHLAASSASTTTETTTTTTSYSNNNYNFGGCSEILVRMAKSEEMMPLVRAEIDWDVVILDLKNRRYDAVGYGDETGSLLVQGILRMDPPLSVVEVATSMFPKACVNMDCFFVACQYCIGNSRNTVEEVVDFIMHCTIDCRQRDGIPWSMLAFLGDARIRPLQARHLLQALPKAVIDPHHGAFGVSPLDRMMSGAFIHGHVCTWTHKLFLALSTAHTGTPAAGQDYLDRTASSSSISSISREFFPFHLLLQRICATDFMGVRFGATTFLHTLDACLQAFPPNVFFVPDKQGRYPLHIVLEHDATTTNLGTVGNKKLLKFLITHHPSSIRIPHPTTTHKLPLRMAMEQSWPHLDYFFGDSNNVCPLHTILSGPVPHHWTVRTSRTFIRSICTSHPQWAKTPCPTTHTMPLTMALQHGWPVHDILTKQCPPSLETRDLSTKFYPFQTCAIAYNNKNNSSLIQLSILYELLQASPTLLQPTTTNSNRKRKQPSSSQEQEKSIETKESSPPKNKAKI